MANDHCCEITVLTTNETEVEKICLFSTFPQT